MALADILAKLEADSAEEVARIVGAAEQRAADILERARANAAAQTEKTVTAATHEAKRQADTMVVGAKLRARDAAVVARRELVAEAVDRLVEEIIALPDDRYAAFIAERVAATARGGEALRIGSADQPRRAAIEAALQAIAPDLHLTITDEPAPFERGAMVDGDRVKVDLSLEAIIEDRRDELEAIANRVLFAEGA